jgi:hypothetical protein
VLLVLLKGQWAIEPAPCAQFTYVDVFDKVKYSKASSTLEALHEIAASGMVSSRACCLTMVVVVVVGEVQTRLGGICVCGGGANHSAHLTFQGTFRVHAWRWGMPWGMVPALLFTLDGALVSSPWQLSSDCVARVTDKGAAQVQALGF